MDQERIGKIIREIRIKNKLSQKELSKKYNVTYQAVSKWETGKNMPDIQILKQICSDYNVSLEEILDGKNNSKSKISKKIILISSIIVSIIIISILFLISLNNKESNFEFKTLSATTEEFSLKGSIAYNKDKTSIYISDVTYNGDDKEIKYKEIKSTLFEINGKTKKEISTYNKSLLITLDDFVTGMTFHIDDHASICKEYTEESLLLEISATDLKNKTTKYDIPISISDNCHK